MRDLWWRFFLFLDADFSLVIGNWLGHLRGKLPGGLKSAFAKASADKKDVPLSRANMRV
jgi:hypothetical protein